MSFHHSDAHSPTAFQSEKVTLPSGEKLILRLLRAQDDEKLLRYFAGLSDLTKSYFGPHPFDAATVREIVRSLDPFQMTRLIAATPADDAIVAYVLVWAGLVPEDAARYQAYRLPLSGETDCTLAPSVADAYQSVGLGNFLMEKALRIARQTGKKRMVLWGGVQVRNQRAVNFYTKFGFERKGEFDTEVKNLDMIRTL
jgi:diamine N-acetyltransferase